MVRPLHLVKHGEPQSYFLGHKITSLNIEKHIE
jgi:hypothetical protein